MTGQSRSVESLMAKAVKPVSKAEASDPVIAALEKSKKAAAEKKPPSAPKAATPSLSSVEKDKIMRTYSALKGNRPVSRQDVTASRAIAARVGAKNLVLEFDKAIEKGHRVPEIPAAPAVPRPAVAKSQPPKAPAKAVSKGVALSAAEQNFVEKVVLDLKKGVHVKVSDIEKAKAIVLKEGRSPRALAFLDESLVSERMYVSIKSGGVKVMKPVAVAAKPGIDKSRPPTAGLDKSRLAQKQPVATTKPPSPIPAGVTPAEWQAYKQTVAAVEKGQRVGPVAIEKARDLALRTGHTETADLLVSALDKTSPGRSRLSRPKGLTDIEWGTYAPVLLALSAGTVVTASKLAQAKRIAQKSGHTETVALIDSRLPKAASVAKPPVAKPPVLAKKETPPKPPMLAKKPPIPAKAALPEGVSQAEWNTYLAVKKGLRREMISARASGKKHVTKLPTASLETALMVATKANDQVLIASLTEQFSARREILAAKKPKAPQAPVAKAPEPAAPYGVRPVDWKRHLNIKGILESGRGVDVMTDDDFEIAYVVAGKAGDTKTQSLAEVAFAKKRNVALRSYMGMKATIAAISQKKPVDRAEVAMAQKTAETLGLKKTSATLADYLKPKGAPSDEPMAPTMLAKKAPPSRKVEVSPVEPRKVSDEPMTPTMLAAKPLVSKKEMAFVAAMIVALDKGQSVRTKDLMRAQEIAQRAGAAEHGNKLALAIAQKRTKEGVIAKPGMEPAAVPPAMEAKPAIPPMGVSPAPALVADVPLSPSKADIIDAAKAAGVPPALANRELSLAKEGDPEAKANITAAAETLDKAKENDPEALGKIQEIQAGAAKGDPTYMKAAAGLAAAGAAAGAIELAQTKSAEKAKEEVLAQKGKEAPPTEAKALEEEAMKAQMAPGEIPTAGLLIAGAGILGVGIAAVVMSGVKKKSDRRSTSTALTVQRRFR